MTDKDIKALAARLEAIASSWHPACQEGAHAIRCLAAELDDAHTLIERLSNLLTGAANALKGMPAPNKLHSWHDLPEVALKVVAERDATEAAAIERCAKIADAHSVIMATTTAQLIGRAIRALLKTDGGHHG